MTFVLAVPAAALTAAGRLRSTAVALLALPGRALDLVDQMERLVSRLDALLESVRVTADRASAVADRAGEVAEQAGGVANEADRVARLSGGIAVEARGVVVGAGEAQQAVAALVADYRPALETLQPTLTRLAETVDPREVEAMVGLVDRLPPILDSVDRDVLPLLGKLNDMAPDLHSLLEAVDDLRRTVAGLPGIGLLKRRGDEEIGADSSARADGDGRPGSTRAG